MDVQFINCKFEPAVGSLYRVNSSFMKARSKTNEPPGWDFFWELIPRDTILLVLSISSVAIVFTQVLKPGSVFNTPPIEFKSYSELIVAPAFND